MPKSSAVRGHARDLASRRQLAFSSAGHLRFLPLSDRSCDDHLGADQAGGLDLFTREYLEVGSGGTISHNNGSDYILLAQQPAGLAV